MAAGHIYILINATMDGYLKIGKTERTPVERARELSQATGVPTPFMVAYSEYVPDCALAEQLIHLRLDQFRTNPGREFFYMRPEHAIRELMSVAEEVRRLVPAVAPSVAWVPQAARTPEPPADLLLLGPIDGPWQRIGDQWFQVRGR